MTTLTVAIFASLVACVTSVCVDVDGVVRQVGESYIGPDGCNTCHCIAGHTNICTKMFCLPENRRCMGPDRQTYSVGESFKSADGCNSCTCTQSGAACTEMACLGVASTVAGLAAGAAGGCLDPVTGVVHPDGSSYRSSDGCNTCGCRNGMEFCTEMACLTG